MQKMESDGFEPNEELVPDEANGEFRCYSLIISGSTVARSWLQLAPETGGEGWQIRTWSEVPANDCGEAKTMRSVHTMSAEGTLLSYRFEEARRSIFIERRGDHYVFSNTQYVISEVEADPAEFFLEDNNFAAMSGLFAMRQAMHKPEGTLRVLPESAYETIELEIETRDQSVSFCGLNLNCDSRGFILSGAAPGQDVRIEMRPVPLPHKLTQPLFLGAKSNMELFPVRHEDLTISSDFGQIHATVATRPGMAPRKELAMLIGGTGRFNRDGQTLSGLSIGYGRFMDALAQSGLPTLRYDRRPSLGAREVLTQQQISEQAKAVCRFICEERKARPVVIGHSYGGLVAADVAAGRDDVALLILVSTPATTLMQAIEWQRQKALEAIVDPGIRENYKAAAAAFDKKLESAELETLSHTERSSVAFIRSIKDKTVFDSLKHVTCPIVILQGADDEQVPKHAAQAINDWLVARGGDVRCHVLDDTGHMLRPKEDDKSVRDDILHSTSV